MIDIKFEMVNEERKLDDVHVERLGVADGFSGQALEPSSEC